MFAFSRGLLVAQIYPSVGDFTGFIYLQDRRSNELPIYNIGGEAYRLRAVAASSICDILPEKGAKS